MIDSNIGASTDAVRAEYYSRKQAFEAAAEYSIRRSTRALVTSGAGVVAALAIFLLNGVHARLAGILIICAFFVSWQISIFLRHRRHAVDFARRATFYERGIFRVDGVWSGKGNLGTQFARDHHLYQNDLGIFGAGSLFELLATVRTEAGAERLSEYLLDPVKHNEARARQEAVMELRSGIVLREEIDILGKYRFHDCNRKRFQGWFDQTPLRASKAIPVLLALSSFLSVVLAIAGGIRLLPWADLAFPLAMSLAGQVGISLAYRREVSARIEVLRGLRTDVSLLREGIELLAPLSFQSAKLASITGCLSERDANKAVRDLEQMLKFLECREDLILYGFLSWLNAGTQLVLMIERWRERNQATIERVLDSWAEFEVLSALAGYAYEHPADAFPELTGKVARFESRGMGHPLLQYRTCVTNDITIDHSNRFYIVSGSNMSGKSTLLRAIGLNTVLAAAGAPVRAEQARIAVMAVCSSIVIPDSLSDGRSKFLAEIERLRDSIAKASSGEPVLFLIDEMLAGTNSRDRRVVAESMLEALTAAGAVGALSTHDLTLTEIAQRRNLRGINVHMQSRGEDDPLDFDYRLRAGIATETNGIAIARMLGLEV